MAVNSGAYASRPITRSPETRTVDMKGAMTACSFKKLVQLLDKQLNLDDQLEVLSHLDTCQICRDAIYQISRDRDEAYFIHRPYNVEKHVA